MDNGEQLYQANLEIGELEAHIEYLESLLKWDSEIIDLLTTKRCFKCKMFRPRDKDIPCRVCGETRYTLVDSVRKADNNEGQHN